jgi:precorrin-2 methylase
MKYKQLVIEKLEQIESLLSRAETAFNHNNDATFYDSVEKLRERMADLKQVIDMEND